jgi:16S rRNA (guanine(966)-N(2))-methyltransferase RsmD
MRVIAGEFRSRRLKSIPGDATRPTPDRLRETLFNVLARRIEGVTFLDAYAGTGAVGIEALSRGPRHAFSSAIATRWRRSGRTWRRSGWSGAPR